MIAFLSGKMAGRSTTSAFIDVQGVGFEVGMSSNSLSKLPESGCPVHVFTYLAVREDALSLYGFTSMEEKELFERLIGVSGVGPKVALAALSFYTPSDLIGAITAQDVTRVSKIPGIGKKTAQRIILELKGTLETSESLFDEAGGAAVSSVTEGAMEALLSMGFTSAEAELAVKGAPEGASEASLIQYALKRLGTLA